MLMVKLRVYCWLFKFHLNSNNFLGMSLDNMAKHVCESSILYLFEYFQKEDLEFVQKLLQIETFYSFKHQMEKIFGKEYMSYVNSTDKSLMMEKRV